MTACITQSHDRVTDEPVNPLRQVDPNPLSDINIKTLIGKLRSAASNTGFSAVSPKSLIAGQ
jgi:hypothetical protein